MNSYTPHNNIYRHDPYNYKNNPPHQGNNSYQISKSSNLKIDYYPNSSSSEYYKLNNIINKKNRQNPYSLIEYKNNKLFIYLKEENKTIKEENEKLNNQIKDLNNQIKEFNEHMQNIEKAHNEILNDNKNLNNENKIMKKQLDQQAKIISNLNCGLINELLHRPGMG